MRKIYKVILILSSVFWSIYLGYYSICWAITESESGSKLVYMIGPTVGFCFFTLIYFEIFKKGHF